MARATSTLAGSICGSPMAKPDAMTELAYKLMVAGVAACSWPTSSWTRGLRWLKGAVNKGRSLLHSIAPITVHPEPLPQSPALPLKS